MVLMAHYLHAQTGFTNYGSLKINNGSALRSSGAFNNKSTANFVNNGSLSVKGNLKNDQASMTNGTGTLVLNGTSQQYIQGTAMFRTASLQTNNAAGIVLNNDLSISGVHSFLSGIITGNSNFIVYQDGASYNGAADNKHVNGAVKKTGSTDFTFPVGNGLVMRDISITALSSSSTFAVQYFKQSPVNPTAIISPLHSIEPNEYWSVSRLSGGNAKLLMNWDDAKVDIPNWLLSEIRVAGYDGSNWSSQGGSATGNVATTGSISSDLITSFNLFTLGSVSSIVPMKLLQFTAKPVNEGTLINWKTAQEKNVSKHIVERSDNGTSFYTTGEVAAVNFDGIHQYQLIDPKKINGHAYYRLRTVDRDGSQNLSVVIKLSAEITGTVQLLNNPVSGTLNLTSNSISGNFTYMIINNAGSAVQQGYIQLNNTRVNIPLNNGIRPGYYTLSLRKGNDLFNIPFIAK